jgi:hypothetical protein
MNLTCKIRGEILNQRFINLLSIEDEGSLDLSFLLETLRVKGDIRKYLIPKTLDINTFSFHIKQLSNILPIFNVIEEDTATFGTNVEYAKFHQYGTTKMAKRKIVFTPREFPRELGINMAKYIVLGEDGIS